MAKNAEKSQEKEPKKKVYDASSITVLEGLEPVRKRTGMYIGTTGPDGFHHLVTEIFDTARDDALGGFATDIEKYNSASKLGWTVLRYTTAMVKRGDAINDVLEFLKSVLNFLEG